MNAAAMQKGPRRMRVPGGCAWGMPANAGGLKRRHRPGEAQFVQLRIAGFQPAFTGSAVSSARKTSANVQSIQPNRRQPDCSQRKRSSCSDDRHHA